MYIKDIIQEIKKQKPTYDEVAGSYNGLADKEHIEYLLEGFDISYDSSEDNYSVILKSLMHCTDIYKIDFGGIILDDDLQELDTEQEGQHFTLHQFAHFNEYILALNNDYSEFFFIDPYEDNRKPVITRCPFDMDKFILAILALSELTINYNYRNIPFLEEHVDRLTRIAGEEGYRNFFKVLLSQYR